MEATEIDKITHNLPHLIRHTRCNRDFLLLLMNREVLAHEDVEDICTSRNPTAQASKLFSILPTRLNAYQVLLEALKDTGQNLVLKILQGGEIPSKSTEDELTHTLLMTAVDEVMSHGELPAKTMNHEAEKFKSSSKETELPTPNHLLEEDGRVMNSAENEKIRRYLPHLLIHTTCDHELLSLLKEWGILSHADIEDVCTFRKPTDRASKLYEILPTRLNSYPALLQALRKTDQGHVIKILEDGIIPPKSVALSVTDNLLKETLDTERSPYIEFQVRDPVTIFTGRKAELSELHEKIMRNKERMTVVSQVTSVSGLGGIGKTQLTRQYIFEHRQDFDNNIIWMDAENEDALRTQFLTLAKEYLKISGKDANQDPKDIQSIVTECYNYFEGKKSLFVFDNAEKTSWLLTYLPSSSSTGSRPHILITSRDREWDRGVEVVALTVLKLSEAMEMVHKGLELEADECLEDVKCLCEALQCFF